MANSISTSIQLYDKISAPINNMIASIENMVGAFESIEHSMNDSFDTAPIQEARRATEQASMQMVHLGNSIEENEQNQREFNHEVKKGASEVDGLTDGILGMVGAYASFQGLQALTNLSDQYVQTGARLDMVNESFKESVDLQEMIFNAAQNSRGAYQATADAVAKLGLNARDAFGSQEEIVAFAETLNKQFVIAGTETAAMEGAMTQLVQALGSGTLRGDELNSIFEAAPNIIQTIADYLEVPIGTIREMASEGQITADIVKNAMLGAYDEIDEKFQSMPMTWGQVWTGIMNELYMASEPLLKAISFLAQNWSIIEPIILSVAAALGVYLAVTKGVELATKAWAAAQAFLNSVMALNPITLVIMGVMLLIGVIYAVVAAINKVTGSTISALGIITGALSVAGAFIMNVVIGLVNSIIQAAWSLVSPIVGIVEWILNACNGGFNSFGGAVANLLGQIIGWFLDLGKIVTTIIDAIFGTDWTSGLTSLQDKVLSWGKNEEAITINREAPQIERFAYDAAWDAGYAFGENFNLGGAFGGTDASAGGYDAGHLPSNIAEIAENTGTMSDAMEITSEDLKYLRDIAETDSVNRFTTAEIKVEMTNNNSVASNMDLDGMVDYLAMGVSEAMEKAAEGVHA